MGRLRLVASFKSQVPVAKELYKRAFILQKRPIILRSLPIVATPYLEKSPGMKQVSNEAYVHMKSNEAYVHMNI